MILEPATIVNDPPYTTWVTGRTVVLAIEIEGKLYECHLTDRRQLERLQAALLQSAK